MARYLIGIDLGTTNSALAYVDLQHPRRGERLDIRSFAIPQLTEVGEIKDRPLLPSFLYLPGQHDLPPRSDGAALGCAAHLRGGRVCAQPRGQSAGTVGQFGQVLAVSRRRRSLGRPATLGRAPGRAAHLAH